MNEPLISICIPVYNGAPYLAECLDSCVNQTFGSFEIVVCDDGSSDNSLEIIGSFAKQHPGLLKLYKNPANLGLVGNWNRCLELAKGTWIKFVFQDDYITPDCLQEFINASDEHTMLAVSKRHFILPPDATADQKKYYAQVVRTLENTSSHTGDFFSARLISKIAMQNLTMNFIGEPSLIFFRKSIIREAGLFNPALKQICDLEFALRVSSRHGLTYVPKQLCAFRIHKQSTTHTNLSNRYFELSSIEPLLFSYFLLFDQNFEAFRRNIGPFYKMKLRLYFSVKAYRAYKVNLKEGHDHYLFNDDNTAFKEIASHKNGNLFVRLVSSFL